jgi:hypothetical protein
MLSIFENRNYTLGSLIRLGDSLARSLRENVTVFSVNSLKNEVSYLTESNKIITGTYNSVGRLRLKNISVKDAEIYTEDVKFDKFVQESIETFIDDLRSNDFDNANTNFNSVLDLWGDRVKFNKFKNKLQEKSNKLNNLQKIKVTKEYSQFVEIKESFIKYLKENKADILSVTQIKDGIKLTNLISKEFNCPKVELDKLGEAKIFEMQEVNNDSIYSLICKQELIKAEILESKENFDSIWLTNEKVKNLASSIKSTDKEITKALAEAIKEIPYVVFATKKQLRTIVESTLKVNSIELDDAEIKNYVSKIFDLKKPIKESLISILNEKYGINVQNLKESISFKSLSNTHVILFEMLSKLSPKDSAQRTILHEMSVVLSNKSGVDIIDLTDDLTDIFKKAEYNEYFSDTPVLETVKFQDIASSLQDIEDIIKSIESVKVFEPQKLKEEFKEVQEYLNTFKDEDNILEN